jgi:hypothetical protein
VELIQKKLQDRKPGTTSSSKRLSEVLRENVLEVTRRSLQLMKADPAIGALPLSDEERIEHLPCLVEELAATLEAPEPVPLPAGILRAASLRGESRHRQGYTIPMLACCFRLLERAIYQVIHENLLSINLSYFVFDLERLNEIFGLQLELILQSYLEAERRPA